MEALCADLAGRGFAVWNLEYRRPDTHGWHATIADVATGLATLHTPRPRPSGNTARDAHGHGNPAHDDNPARESGPGHDRDDRAGRDRGDALGPNPGPNPGSDPGSNPGLDLGIDLDLDRMAVAGHSAGAQLALRAVADGARAALAVSLAGVLDLVEGDRRWLSSGAVAAAMGGPSAAPGERPSGDADVYGAGSPLLRVPIGVPQLIVQGAADDLDLIDFGRRYAQAARRAGDDVTYLEPPGGHFDVITPTTSIWQAAAEAITAALA
ncbi:hypothetical protein E1294_28865 [Nonomuraea diastatica]|uniref:Alpha/beta hydrolase n=2 Tax=Nonomuraea diastatica TaxID=1848329 RepID=A0A4R4WKS3_9ACTN|nr:hypothetical protein E1294_28865 [Nonomuraea diastatica]